MSTPNALQRMSPDRGEVMREDFTGREVQNSAETALAAVTARERALVEAQYLIAERHPRMWPDVRARIMDHCSRPRFAEISRYAKPVGSKKENGEWVKEFARGFTVRFAETLAQEMGHVKPDTAVTYEDDMLRIVRFSVTDLQRNIPRSREVTIAKAVEKRGRKQKNGTWEPPEGREVISQRLNSYGDMTYLVKATDDELRSKINSEESKTQRDFILKLCPRDILEDCEDAVLQTMEKEDKTDPKAALKRWLDSFKRAGILPSDLMTYVGKPLEQFGQSDIAELRELSQAIKEGASFSQCLRIKWDKPAEGEEETQQQHDERLRRQGEEQLAKAKAKEQPGKDQLTGREPEQRDLTPEENKALDEEIMRQERQQAPKEAPPSGKRKLSF